MVKLRHILRDYREAGSVNRLLALWGFVDDETFLKHMDKRHKMDTHADLPLVLFPNRVSAWVKLYRTWHEKLHDESRPHRYEHMHEEPSWMEDV